MVALTFALLPFYSSCGLSIAGLPLALYAFLNFRQGRHSIKDWLILLSIPLYSSFVLSFAFFLFAIFVFWLYDLLVSKKANYIFLLAIFAMALVFLIVEYRLVYSMFLDSGFISQRVEYEPFSRNLGIVGAVMKSVEIFMNGQHMHAASLHVPLIALALIMALMVGLKIGQKEKPLVILLIVIALTSVIYGLWHWKGLIPLKKQVDILGSLNFSRFHFLHPLLWYIVFALCLKLLLAHIQKYGKLVVVILIIFQLVFSFYNHDAWQQRNNPTFKEFYSEELFDDIKSFIGTDQDSYSIASIGLHPSVSQYNGFYTIDGYFTNYPLEYKSQFRKIIEKELEKNPDNAAYFDLWGNRAYIFVAEFPWGWGSWMITKDSKYTINNLQLNIDEFEQMGGKYIFSAVPINNASDNNLIFEKKFTNAKAHWTIYLYKVN